MRVFVENEAGSTVKHVYDEQTLKHLRDTRVSAAYPFAYGFVLGTRSGDGDAVDCFIVTRTKLDSGSIVQCNAVGLLEQIEDGTVDHKVIAALPGDRISIDNALRTRLVSFVTTVFSHVPGKRMQIGHLFGHKEAEAYIRQCTTSGGRSP